jgi:hypothetical protein
MSEHLTGGESTAAPVATAEPAGAYRYPEGRVAGVVDTAARLTSVMKALTDGGFAGAEILVASGPAAADVMRASTGRTGLTNLVIRIADRLGVTDEEMELKAEYEQALRDGLFVVSVPAPTGEREQSAARLLRQHGGHSVRFMGRFSIHGIVAPTVA